MDRLSPFDSLTELLLKYPPKSFISRNQENKRRLANFFKEEDFPVYHNFVKPKSHNENTIFHSQKTKDLINEVLSDIKTEENTMKMPENPSTNKMLKNQENLIESLEIINENPFEKIEENNEIPTKNKLSPEQKALSDESSLRVMDLEPKVVKSKSFPLILEKIEESPEEIHEILTFQPETNNNLPNLHETSSFQGTPIFSNEKPFEEILQIKKTNSNEFFSFEPSNNKTVSFSEDAFPIKNQISLILKINNKQISEIPKNPEESLENIEKFIHTNSLPLEENQMKEPLKEIGSPTHPMKKKTKLEQSFHINKWGELQSSLKKEYNLLNQENELQNRLISEIRNKHFSYFRNYLKLKAMKFVLTENIETKPQDLVLIEEPKKILRDMTDNVQSLLTNLIKQPRKMAQMVFKQRSAPLTQKFEGILETFSKTFFENLTTEEPYQIGFLRFVDEIIKV